MTLYRHVMRMGWMVGFAAVLATTALPQLASARPRHPDHHYRAHLGPGKSGVVVRYGHLLVLRPRGLSPVIWHQAPRYFWDRPAHSFGPAGFPSSDCSVARHVGPGPDGLRKIVTVETCLVP